MARMAVRNIAAGYFDKFGFHPLRSSPDYDPDRAGEYGESRSNNKGLKFKPGKKKKKAVAKKAKKRKAAPKRKGGVKRKSNPYPKGKFIKAEQVRFNRNGTIDIVLPAKRR